MNIYVKPSSPFVTGDLHLGHVRSYTISDTYARWMRSQGHEVLYGCGFDAFGLPVELEAEKRGIAPEEWVRSCIEQMTEQMKRLNLSLDYDSLFNTSDPDIYHWSQYIFLLLLENDLIYRDTAEVNYCEHCETTLANLQVDGKRCWRCHNQTIRKNIESWFLRIEAYREENSERLDELQRWDSKAIRSQKRVEGELGDFPISRQRKWGCPIPITNCTKCGPHPVCFEDLPIKVGQHVAFCKRCGVTVPLETDTLDSHFDGIWKWIPSCVPVEARKDEMLCHPDLQKWLPAGMVVAGADVGGFLYNQRWLTKALRDIGPLGFLENGEPFAGTLVHEMVLAEDGRKMSKHLGNATDPMEIIDEYGSDILRYAILCACGPSRALKWNDTWIGYSSKRINTLSNHIKSYAKKVKFADNEPHCSSKVSKHRRYLLELRDKKMESVERAYENLQFSFVISNCNELVKATRRYDRDVARAKGRNLKLYQEDYVVVLDVLSSVVDALAPIIPGRAKELQEILYGV